MEVPDRELFSNHVRRKGTRQFIRLLDNRYSEFLCPRLESFLMHIELLPLSSNEIILENYQTPISIGNRQS